MPSSQLRRISRSRSETGIWRPSGKILEASGKHGIGVRFTAAVIKCTIFCNDEGSATTGEYQCGRGTGRRDPLKILWGRSGEVPRFVYREPVAIGEPLNYCHFALGVE